MRAVHDFRDIPLLYVVDKGEKKMGWTRRSTPERLDKIIQFIWDYQDKHNGDTPSGGVIARHVGINENGIGYWLSLLVDDGRIDKISARPFRARIIDTHPKNKSAIMRWKRLREKIEESDAAERERIRAEQEREREETQRVADKSALFEATTEPSAPRVEGEVMVRDEARATVVPDAPSPDARAVQAFTEAQARVREVNREVRQMMPKLLKIADERDLVFELISRGYTITKA